MSVVTTVADNGPGIPAELIDKIREPFFTTKSGQGGTGLGLSMVDAFARQHGGSLGIDSEPGRGARISLVFPRAGDRLDESIAATMPLLSLPSGTEKVVALARDTSLLATIEQILTVLGYSVACSTSLQDAGESIRSRRPELVIADGFDVLALLNLCPPPDRGAACRGIELVAPAEHRGGADDMDVRVLRLGKPFSLPDLARAVRKILDRTN
jgi:CheY-like chemotaxis protein